MEIGVGVEFSSDQVLDLSTRRGIDMGQAVDVGVSHRAVGLLANDKGECEGELIVIVELQ